MTLRILVLSALVLGLPLSASAERPNILFILADDLGWADTTLYGHTDLYETPHLERLAARGMTFSRAYTSSPLCSPTRSAILTGLHPARTGLTAPNCHTPKLVLKATAAETGPPSKKLTPYDSVTRLDPKYETLAERFRAEGYTTAHFGKWHLGAEPYSPFEHGFDIDIPHHPGPGPAGSFVAPWKFRNFTEKYPKEHIEDRMGDEAVAFLESHGSDPFFLNYWQFSVHAPFDAKQDLIEKYRPRIDPEDEQRSPTYAAMVESLDDNIGKMLDALDRLEIADETIIIFTSDNGGNMYNEVDGTTPTSNRPLRGGKGNNWDGGVRVPAVIVWPGVVEPGSRSEALITSTDFYPTLLEMCGLAPSTGQSFDGLSLVPALRQEPFSRDAIFTYFPHSTGVPDTLPPSAAIYQWPWKLFRFFHQGENGAHEHALYHLGEDIGERNDLAGIHPDRVTSMAADLDSFLRDTGAVHPGYNPNFDADLGLLARKGIRPTRNCSLSIEDNTLILESTGENPHITLTYRPLLPAGLVELHVTFTSEAPGRIDFRWSEKGIQPPFFKDRLKRSRPYAAGEETTIILSFNAAREIPSSRVDFMQEGGAVRISGLKLLQNGKPMWRCIPGE